MIHNTIIRYTKGMSFDVELDGHHFDIDADEEFGGQDRGPKPKKLLLSALAGCTGMDVVSILRKMRMPFDEFWLEADGDLNDAEPSVYTAFTIRYCFRGKELDKAKIEKAVNLSQERYCGVSSMFRSFAKIETAILLNPAP
jgi:putative redox protein